MAEQESLSASNAGDRSKTKDAMAASIRDAYIRARFPGVAYCAEDLGETERVIRAARLYFDESHKTKANELLDLAIGLFPGREDTWLARLELAYLQRNSQDFCDVARALRHVHPASLAWDAINQLGLRLNPDDRTFGPKPSGEASHYGPWPDTPNWIQASWDLTSEVRAADFHNAMLRRGHAAAETPYARVA